MDISSNRPFFTSPPPRGLTAANSPQRKCENWILTWTRICSTELGGDCGDDEVVDAAGQSSEKGPERLSGGQAGGTEKPADEPEAEQPSVEEALEDADRNLRIVRYRRASVAEMIDKVDENEMHQQMAELDEEEAKAEAALSAAQEGVHLLEQAQSREEAAQHAATELQKATEEAAQASKMAARAKVVHTRLAERQARYRRVSVGEMIARDDADTALAAVEAEERARQVAVEKAQQTVAEETKAQEHANEKLKLHRRASIIQLAGGALPSENAPSVKPVSRLVLDSTTDFESQSSRSRQSQERVDASSSGASLSSRSASGVSTAPESISARSDTSSFDHSELPARPWTHDDYTLSETDSHSRVTRPSYTTSLSQGSKSSDAESVYTPRSTGATPGLDGVDAIRQEMTAIYKKHNPRKLKDVDGLLAEWVGEEELLLDNIRKKYLPYLAYVSAVQSKSRAASARARQSRADALKFNETWPGISYRPHVDKRTFRVTLSRGRDKFELKPMGRVERRSRVSSDQRAWRAKHMRDELLLADRADTAWAEPSAPSPRPAAEHDEQVSVDEAAPGVQALALRNITIECKDGTIHEVPTGTVLVLTNFVVDRYWTVGFPAEQGPLFEVSARATPVRRCVLNGLCACS